MKIENDVYLDYNDVLIKPKRTTLSSRSEVDLMREFKFSKYTWNGIPIIASNMDTIGTYAVYKVMSKNKMLTALHKYYKPEDYKYMDLDPNYYFLSTGIQEKDWDNFNKSYKNLCEPIYNNQSSLSNIITQNQCTRECKFICIDVANGYSILMLDYIRKIRESYPNNILMAGNVTTNELVSEYIIDYKVDIVKCGIGGGSCCLTRRVTGCGMPMLSCNIECSESAHALNKYICSDGGITDSGSIMKAFGSGSDFVMCGNLFSGHEENDGTLIEENGKKYKTFYGMASNMAILKHNEKKKYRTSEGKSVKVPYKGNIQDTIDEILAGIRSGCSYINAKKIKNVSKCTTFIKVNKIKNDFFGEN